jgi:hypothetical protein
VGSGVVLDAVVKRKMPSPRRESNPKIPVVQTEDLGGDDNIRMDLKETL